MSSVASSKCNRSFVQTYSSIQTTLLTGQPKISKTIFPSFIKTKTLMHFQRQILEFLEFSISFFFLRQMFL